LLVLRYPNAGLCFSGFLGRWLVLASLAGSMHPILIAARPQADIQDLLDQARANEKKGEYEKAERVYSRALTLTPGNLEVLKRLGIVQQTELKFAESILHFRRVLAQNPQYPEVNFFLGVSYFGENDFSHAIPSFEQELATKNPNPRCRYYLALALQYAGRTDEAIKQLNLAVEGNPKDADALYQLARIHKNASVQAIERLKSLGPDSFQLHALMGEVYADQERYNEAAKEYQAALAKRPDAPGVHYAIGVAYWAQHQIGAAQKEFLDALKENPHDALTNLYLGDIAVQEGQFAKALEYLQVAEKGQPGMAQVHVLLGKCYRGQNDHEKARAEFLAAIEADPKAAQPHYLLAQVYRELHNPQASAREIAEFERLSKSEKERTLQDGPQN
jgi:tetratricopeptide (TPR) repeat protein